LWPFWGALGRTGRLLWETSTRSIRAILKNQEKVRSPQPSCEPRARCRDRSTGSLDIVYWELPRVLGLMPSPLFWSRSAARLVL
jgi:hypothetical protein